MDNNEDPDNTTLIKPITITIDEGVEELDKSELSEANRGRGSSGEKSVTSGSTTIGNPEFNSLILINIDPSKQDGKVTISFTELRSNTVLGSTQGAHVIAHRFFLAFCAKIMAGKKLREIAQFLHDALVELTLKIQTSEKYIPLENLKISDYDQTVIDLLRQNGHTDAIEQYKLGVRQQRITVITQYISGLLGCYNSLPDVTNHTDTPNPAQGREVSTALLALEAIHHFLSLPQNLSKEDKINFYNQTIAVGAPFVHGMHKIFEQGVEAIRNDIKPKNSSQSPEENFFDYFFEKINHPETIGRILAFLFDYPKSINAKIPDFFELSARFIKMIKITFPKFGEKINEIIEAFSKHTIQRGNWNTQKNKLIPPDRLIESIKSQTNAQLKQSETEEPEKNKGLKL